MTKVAELELAQSPYVTKKIKKTSISVAATRVLSSTTIVLAILVFRLSSHLYQLPFALGACRSDTLN